MLRVRALYKLKFSLKLKKKRLTTREEERTGDNLDETDKQHVFCWFFLLKFFQLYIFFGPKCNRSVAEKNPKLDAVFKYLLRFQRVSSGARNIWWLMLTHFGSDYVNDTGFLPTETDSPRKLLDNV